MTVKFLLESSLIFSCCFRGIRVNVMETSVKNLLYLKGTGKSKVYFTTKIINGLLVSFLCILLEPAHLTSDKSPWQYFVLSKRECQYSHIDELWNILFIPPFFLCHYLSFYLDGVWHFVAGNAGCGWMNALAKINKKRKAISPPGFLATLCGGPNIKRVQTTLGLADTSLTNEPVKIEC